MDDPAATASRDDSPRALVMVPAYNEGQVIARTLRALRRLPDGFDVLVVNDGSSDDTSRQARKAGARVLDLACNLGVGGAVQAGYQYARSHGYDIAIQFDADGQHRVSEIPRLVEPVLSGQADLVIGSRYLQGLKYRFSMDRLLGSRYLSLLVNSLLRGRITDPTSGFRAAGSRAIRFFSTHYPQSWLGDTVEALVQIGRRGYAIHEVPTRMARRKAGTSAAGTVTGLVHMIRITLAVLIECIERVEPSERPEGDRRPIPADRPVAGEKS